MYPKSIQKLIDEFTKFPTIGPRAAARFVFYLIKLPEKNIKELTDSISELNKKIKLCQFCFNAFEPSSVPNRDNLCEICSNPLRDKTSLCVVEKETDLLSLEKTNQYKGLYFVLGKTLSTLKKDDIEELKIEELKERIKNPEKFGIKEANFNEIIIATNLTTEGETTALYIEKTLASFKKKITRLGKGLPIGGELEYADEETLISALEGRK